MRCSMHPKTDDATDGAVGVRPFQVLLVEDQDAHAMVIERATRKLDEPLEIVRARDGTEAVDRLRRPGASLPHLILLDLKLPRMTGLDVLRAIKSDPDLLAIPVVVLTTSVSEHDRSEAFRLHANAYVQKPDTYDGFRQVIRTIAGFWVSCNVPPTGLGMTG